MTSKVQNDIRYISNLSDKEFREFFEKNRKVVETKIPNILEAETWNRVRDGNNPAPLLAYVVKYFSLEKLRTLEGQLKGNLDYNQEWAVDGGDALKCVADYAEQNPDNETREYVVKKSGNEIRIDYEDEPYQEGDDLQQVHEDAEERDLDGSGPDCDEIDPDGIIEIGVYYNRG